jgi:hypothetical protein
MHSGKLFCGFLVSVCLLHPQGAGDALENAFRNPPDSARPRVWWHWMNGNITREGIRLDLEWMKRTGIAGFQNFDAALATPQVVEKRLVYMTPEWQDAFRYAATLADQHKLEMAIAASPGWSESGGPWVKPEQAMKKYVWSETLVEGGKPFSGKLAQPPGVTGPLQGIPFRERAFGASADSAAPKPQYYADSAVVAFPLPASEVPLATLRPKVTASGGKFDLPALIDGDLDTPTALPVAPVGEKAWIAFEFAAPQAVRALTLALQGGGRRNFGRQATDSGQELEASGDGANWRTIVKLPPGGAAANTISFEPVTARHFRLTFRTLPPPPAGIMGGLGRGPAGPTAHQVAELALHTGARVNRFELKAGFATATELYSAPTPLATTAEAISKAAVVDLTAKLRPDGTLDWTPPAGRWLVLRFGYSLIGTINHPASPEATGLEVDKLSRKHVRAYIDHYLDQYQRTVGPLMGKRGLGYVIIDSWEAGTQNWTEELLAEFARRRGYDARPWLPVLAGRVVNSAAASDRFLWDFRKTIGTLTSDYHYDEIGAALRARGMGRYTESHESGRAFIGDGMDVKRNAEIPMSAMWTPRPGTTSERYDADIRESASVAHIYGQNIAAAESLTAGSGAWSFSPETLKSTADREMAMGLNRFVIHTSVHQPVNDKIPGLGLGPFGQWFTRHETWGELARPWIDYLSRSCHLLQQGRFVADVAYFYGEDSNITALFSEKAPEVPAGYNFDYVSADALLTRLSAEGGRLVSGRGMSYRLLYLDPHSRFMTLPLLRKIQKLVEAGVPVAGPKPVTTPSLGDDLAEFDSLANQLWGSGKVNGNATLAQALAAARVDADFSFTSPRNDTTLFFVHRQIPDGEIYWVNNRNARDESVEASFRVTGKEAELWYPETGKTAPASYRSSGGRTTVPLRLQPEEAVFVVFRKPATAASRSLPVPAETSLGSVEGAWEVGFQADRGAPQKLTFSQLGSFTDHADAGVKYFSGTATYTKSIDAPAAWFQPGARLWLDLGDVKNLAEVSVNGQALGIVWKKPFRVDVTTALKRGQNTLEVKVTNLWVNRLVGDQQPGVTRKYTYTAQQFYRADSPLLPSGLIGPVRVVSAAAR